MTALQTTGGRAAKYTLGILRLQRAASSVASVPKIQSSMMGEPSRFARKQPTARPGMASGNRKGSTVMASATRNWTPMYCGMGRIRVAAA